MNRKSQMMLLEILAGLIFAAVLILLLMQIGGKIFRLSGKALEDFNKLDQLIDEISHPNTNEGSIIGLPVAMDKETAIFFFDNENIEFSGNYYITGGITVKKELYAALPEECKDKNGCLCLARKVEIPPQGEVKLKEVICKQKDYSFSGVQAITREFFSDDTQDSKSIYVEKAADSLFICTELVKGKSCIPEVNISLSWSQS